MNKQVACALCMGALMLSSALAYAAREEHRFEVSVDIPTLGFYVIPAESNWIHREQTLSWDLGTSRLGGLRKNFDVRHDSGAIEARLESAPYLSNGRDEQNIFLQVQFNDRLLSHEPQPREVVPAEQARTGGRFPLVITPRPPAGGYKPGTYYGNVLLVFSAAAP
ncbi:CS1 type fimbrial major subunit [Pseudomonas sp. Pseusp3]|uniref:CS1 type fimbrial major subunit n=1 Tax=Pseudomonas sp. Pseusp3 TaxID=3243029 RepID=UPI0039B02A5E